MTEQTKQPISGPVKLSIIVKQFMEIKQQTVRVTLSGAEEREKSMLKHQLMVQDALLRRNTINVDSENWSWIKTNLHALDMFSHMLAAELLFW